ncbi:MAG: 3-deoxy-7-phosphoheptulonate synthase [Alicyclobacillaceae bacterium]|nr:3-deoxy-7-phosphoheptulonate synthase [Alicyclobacillaceae bacterium]
MRDGGSGGEAELAAVVKALTDRGFACHAVNGGVRAVVVQGGDAEAERLVLGMPGVHRVVLAHPGYALASREVHPADTVIRVGSVEIGGQEPVIMAGPCSVESLDGLLEVAEQVRAAGANVLRGGAFKPRSSPYSFQGLGEEGLKYLAIAREKTGLPVISEVMEPDAVGLVASYVDILQIGARNMQNFSLLRAVGRSGKPVMLKRGLSATIEEWLMAAEYILAQGNPNVMLCERGIRTFETYTRNTLDLNAVPVVRHLSHLPVIVDPSHGVGKWRYVNAMARASIAAGAHGLIVEVHANPDKALSDGAQSLTPARFAQMVREVRYIAAALRAMDGAEPPADAAAGAEAVSLSAGAGTGSGTLVTV